MEDVEPQTKFAGCRHKRSRARRAALGAGHRARQRDILVVRPIIGSIIFLPDLIAALRIAAKENEGSCRTSSQAADDHTIPMRFRCTPVHLPNLPSHRPRA